MCIGAKACYPRKEMLFTVSVIRGMVWELEKEGDERVSGRFSPGGMII